MNGWQTALVVLTFVILLVDIFFTRKWIRVGNKIIEQQRAALRAMGYADARKEPEQDERDT
jgi:hypothetical protein